MAKTQLQVARKYAQLCFRINFIEIILVPLGMYGFLGLWAGGVIALISSSGIDVSNLFPYAVAALLTYPIRRYLRKLKKEKVAMEQEMQAK